MSRTAEAPVCLQAKGIGDENGGVGRSRQADGLKNDEGGVGRRRGIRDASEVLKTTTEAVGNR